MLGVEVEIFRSNVEGTIVSRHAANDHGFDAAIFKPAAFGAGYPALVAAISQVKTQVTLMIGTDDSALRYHAKRASRRDELRQLDGELERRRTELAILEASRRAAPAHAQPGTYWIDLR